MPTCVSVRASVIGNAFAPRSADAREERCGTGRFNERDHGAHFLLFPGSPRGWRA
jgi:hypothetical protein